VQNALSVLTLLNLVQNTETMNTFIKTNFCWGLNLVLFVTSDSCSPAELEPCFQFSLQAAQL